VALGERDPDALDYYVGPENLVADIRRSPPKVAEIKQSANELAARLTAFSGLSGDRLERSRFLLSQLRATAARANLLSRIQPSQIRLSQLALGFTEYHGFRDD